MVELESDSHSDIMGIVEAYFTQNIVQVFISSLRFVQKVFALSTIIYFSCPPLC
jgi:hypothetical protein